MVNMFDYDAGFYFSLNSGRPVLLKKINAIRYVAFYNLEIEMA